MNLKTKLFGKVYTFGSVKEVLAKANEEKSGDILAGISAHSVQERIAAKEVLSNLSIKELRENPVVPYESDEVTRLIQDNIKENGYEKIKNTTMDEFREWLLDEHTSGEDIKEISPSLSSEVIAGVTKLMSNLDLVQCAKKINITATCNTTIGQIGKLSARLQPNHPSDDIDGILISLYEGLSYGVGDALIGLNPVIDSSENIYQILSKFYEVKEKWQIPTQNCVLSHVSTQMKALQNGAPLDLMFQSLAGSQKGNEAFGIDINMLNQAHQMTLELGRAKGKNVMYFETGQGSELSSNSHFDADQVTMEARCYGLARFYKPFVVNTVVGFIGPEYLYDGKQVIRAALEDHFMGKLSGLPMGVDACYTNHMKADQNDIENLALLLSMAGCVYFMGVPASDDVMLNYQSTSYHDIQTLREICNLRPTSEFEVWLENMDIVQNGKFSKNAGDASIFLK